MASDADDDDDYFDEGVNNVIDGDDDLDDDDDEVYDDDDEEEEEEDNAINEVDVANAYGRGAQQQMEQEKSRAKAEKLSRPALDEPFNHDYQSDMPYFDNSYGDEDNGRYLSANGYQADEPVRNSRFNAAQPVRSTVNGIYSVSLARFFRARFLAIERRIGRVRFPSAAGNFLATKQRANKNG